MWGGGGGNLYWGGGGDGASTGEAAAEGIVVVFAWTSSKDSELKAFVDLCTSTGWRSLVCHAHFFTLFSPEKATSLAFGVVDELMKEVKFGPKPIIFAAFSGGAKICMYKVFQLIEGKCERQICVDVDYQLVRDCICGQIYDSGPLDLSSDCGARFLLGPRIAKLSHSPRVVSWMARALASGLDALSLSRFEIEHAEYWQTLYSSVNKGPFLILCSEADELAPFPIICNFVERLRELGGDVTLVNWMNSQHLGHHKHHDAEYRIAVSKLLQKAAAIFSQRRQQLNRERNLLEGSGSHVYDGSFWRLQVESDDDPFLPRSLEYNDAKKGKQKMNTFQVQNPPMINTNSVLGQILFDVCVPKNVEEWDIKSTSPTRGRQVFGFAHSLNSIRRMRRSRL